MDTIKHVIIDRLSETKELTVGTIAVVSDSVIWEGATIELPYKDNQRNISCVPKGTYFMGYRSDRNRWELSVPNRSGIQIHGGTKPQHSRGCIILPDIKGFDKALEPYRNHILKIFII